MKHRPKDYCESPDAKHVVTVKIQFLAILFVLFCGGLARAQSLDASSFTEVLDGSAIEFTEGEYILSHGTSSETLEWVRLENPNIEFINQAREYRAMTGRFTFDRSIIDADSIALHLIGMRWNFTVSVNDVEVFRNYTTATEQKNAWYRPYLIPIGEILLKSGLNEITIHAFSHQSVGIGRVVLGADAALGNHYQTRHFWHITAPTAVNFTMLVLGFLFLTIWVARKHEIELLWLSLAAVFWFIRNYEYFADELPIGTVFYSALAICMTYFATAASAAFYFYFIKLKNRFTVTVIMFAVGTVVSALFVGTTLPNTVIYFPTTAVVTYVAFVAIRDLLKHPSIEQGVLGFAGLFMPFASFYDLAMLILYNGNGHATYLTVFGGGAFAIAFSISFGRRVLNSFEGLGQSNMILEQSIAQTRAELMESEALRRDLQISQALTSERTRLMQEMHDGIGSNLTTALTVARRQEHPPNTITVLKRALGDLKLTVDSLEPIEGDVVALIGNLRHRMARDLADADITCKWEVEDCDDLTWLDATNALHVLRIHNEAISNVLSHAQATEMRIGCKEQEYDGRPGILTYVTDNGRGFQVKQNQKGKGLSNIQTRATSLHGKLEIESSPEKGTTIRLWLPYKR